MSEESDPLARFAALYEAARATGVSEPNAMVLATVDAEGRPWTRVLLLKGFDERGFVFYTNLESRKGRHLAANPAVSLNFFWRRIEGGNRQVVIEGRAEPVGDREADDYFATRARGSQLGAWASRQSRPLGSRAALLAEVGRLALRHPLRVPRPPFWSGYRVVPDYFEFWVEGRFRLHDRTVYERDGDGWRSYKVYP